MSNFPKLEARPELREVAYHLDGLLEAVEVIRGAAAKLEAAIDDDPEGATDAMGVLEAEIYTHLTYHMKELRRPFRSYFRVACKELETLESASSAAKEGG